MIYREVPANRRITSVGHNVKFLVPRDVKYTYVKHAPWNNPIYYTLFYLFALPSYYHDMKATIVHINISGRVDFPFQTQVEKPEKGSGSSETPRQQRKLQ